MSTGELNERATASVMMGDPDGPERFVDSLGESVPTFIDPRLDLLSEHFNARRFSRLDYHVPFPKRGIYKPEWLPDEYRERIRGSIKTDLEGYVICSGTSKIYTNQNHRVVIGTRPCQARAVNRAGVCRLHGGALHPANRKLSAQTSGKIPANRVHKLDRVQKFMQGFLKFDELTDEEVIGGFIFNDQGRPIASTKLGNTVHQGLTQELFKRMTRYMQMKLPIMLERISSIATSDVVEPETQLKASIWMAERTMGKTPEVVLHGQTEAPYEGILQQVLSGSRDERRAQRALGSGGGEDDPNIIDGEVVDFDDGDESGEGEPDSDDFDTPGDGDSVGDSASSEFGNPGQDGDLQPTDAGISSTGGGETDPGSDTGSLESVSGRIENAKDIRDRIKKAKSRRFAARANGAPLDQPLDQTSWVVEFKPIPLGVLGISKPGICTTRVRAYKARFYAPIHQTVTVLARIKARQEQYEAGDPHVDWWVDFTERNQDGIFPESSQHEKDV
jgi:hypothetical protein